MADESSFLVEIVLKAIDQASGPIRNLGKAVDDLKAKSAVSDLGDDLDDVGRAARDSEGDLRKHREELDRSRQATSRHADETERASGALDDHADSADAARQKVKGVADETDNLATKHQKATESARKLSEAQQKLQRDFDDGSKSTDDYVNGLNRISQGYDRLSKSLPIGDQLGDSLHRSSLEAKAWGDSYSASVTQAIKAHGQHQAAMEREQAATQQLTARVHALSDEYRGLSVSSGRMSNDDQRRSFQQISQEASNLTRQLQRGSEAWREMSRVADESKRSSRGAGVSSDADRLLASYQSFDRMAKAGQVTASAAKDSYRDFATSFDRLRDSIDKGSDAWRQYGRLIDDATRKARDAKAVVSGGGLISGFFGNLGGAVSGGGMSDLDRAFQNLSAHADSFGIKIVSLSAQLRGLALTAGLGLFQQLDTAIVGVVGSLFSVASAATQAAAALGGSFVAAVGEAIPVVAIAADAFNRLKVIIQAVQAAQNLQQQTATNASQQRISSLSGTNSVISAEQNLVNSYEAVKTAQDAVSLSQQNLTVARLDAQRQITNLMYAEEQAELQAKGANISLQQAQQGLQQTILTGGTGTTLESAQLQVSQAQLGARQANTAVPRDRYDYNLARRQGVSGAPSVEAATQSVTQASQSLVQAQQAVGNASRALEIARLQAAQSTSAIAQASQALKYLLDQMTPAERKVYDALDALAKYFRDPSSPLNRIGDYLVAPFADGLDRVLALLKDRKFLAPLDSLGKEMGDGLKRIIDQVLGKQGAGFFDQMAGDASKNVPIIVSSIQALIKIFEDIAKAATPALDAFIKGFNHVVTGLAAKWSTPQGLDKLTDFFNKGAKYAEDFAHWGGAVLNLLMALGHQAAPVGGGLLQGWTSSLNSMSAWVQSHGPEVHNFFVQAGGALNTLARVVGALGIAMVQLMNAGALRQFADLMQNVIVPVLRDAFRVLGVFTNGIIALLNGIPGLHTFFDAFGGAAVAAIALGKLYAPLHSFITLLSALKSGGSAFLAMRDAGGGLLTSLNAAKDAVADRLSLERQIVTAIQEQTAALDEQLGVQREATAGLGAEEGVTEGGVILPRGVSGEAAGVTSVTGEEVAGGTAAGGLAAGASALGPLALIAGGGALAAQLLESLFHGTNSFNQQEYISSGGQLSKSTNIPAGLRGAVTSDFQKQISPKIASQFLSQAQGIDPNQLSTDQLRSLHSEAEKILQLPDITAKQRLGLSQLATELNPITAAIGKLGQEWGSTFQGINSTTGNVMTQVKQVLKTDLANISINLGNGTTQGAEALSATISGAYSTIVGNTNLATRGVQNGLKQINTMLNSALKEMGAPSLTGGDMKALGPTQTMQWLQYQGTGGTGSASAGGFRASGGWNRARPGGTSYVAGEAGYDEVTLTTDPKYASRQASLIGQYLQRAPHMATGGFVPEPGTNFTYGEEPEIVGALTKMADAMGVTIYGISGYRSPQHSVEVGGFADDPHTRGQAADVGVNSLMRSSASAISNAMAQKYGLWRPFDLSGQDPNEINHFQLLPGAGGPAIAGEAAPKSGTAAAAIANAVKSATSKITAPKSGAAGTIGTIANAALSKVTAAANSYLAGVTGTQNVPGLSGGSTAGLSGDLRSIVSQLAQRFHWTSQISDWLKVINKESGGSMTAQNPTSNAYGIAQFINGASEYAQYGGNSTTMSGQLLAMANYIKQRYVTPAAAWAHEVADNWYAKGGLLGTIGSFAGGGMAPWGGRPVPIVAHEGERISNPGQWGHIAGLAGMSGPQLDQHMGYDTKSPRQSFDVGGPVPTGPPVAEPQTPSSTAPWPSLRNVNWGAISSISQIVQYMNLAFSKLGDISTKSSSFAKNFIPFVNQLLTQNTGVFDRLNTAFTVIQNALSSALVIGGRAAGAGMTSAQSGYLQGIRSPYQVTSTGVRETMAPAGQDAQNITALDRQRTYLRGEQSLVGSTLSQVSRRLTATRKLATEDPSKYKSALQSLTTQYNNLLNRMQTLTGTIAQNVSDTFSAEQSRVQDLLSGVSDVYNTQQQQIQGRQQTAQTAGNYSQLPSFDRALASSATSEIKALQPVLKAAQKSGDPDLVAQIKQQISQLQATAAQAAVQAILDAQSAIDQASQTTQAGFQSQQTVEQALGNYSKLPSIDQQYATAIQSQIDQLQPLLAQAQAAGDSGAVAQIQQEIDQLQGTVAQMTAQMIQDQISGIQQTAQTQQAQVSEYQTIAQTLQGTASTPGQFAQAGAINLQALQLNQSSLQGQLGAYNGLLGQAIDSGNTGAVATITQTIDQLTAELAQNSAALQDNTAQVVQQTSQFIQARGQFQTGVYGGLAQIINTIGQTTGYTDIKALAGVTSASNQSLQNTNSGLLGQLSQLGGGASGIASMLGGATNPSQFASMLGGVNLSQAESGQDQTWVTTFESIIQSLESNTEAIATNNQQLATLNGQLLQPQQWSTSAWSSFRSAIFSGMGNLLPQYQSILSGSAMPMIAPTFNPISGSSSSPTIGELNINHAPTLAFDPQLVGEQLAHEASTALG